MLKIYKLEVPEAAKHLLEKPIIKAIELKSLNDILSWCNKQQEKIQAEYITQKEQWRQTNNEAYQEGMAKAHNENNKLFESLQTKLNEMFNDLEIEINSIVLSILDKLGIDNISTAKLTNLIQRELIKTKLAPSYVQIQACAATLPQLQQDFANNNLIKFQINDDLLPDECIYLTDTYVFRVNIQDAKQQIHAVLKINNYEKSDDTK